MQASTRALTVLVDSNDRDILRRGDVVARWKLPLSSDEIELTLDRGIIWGYVAAAHTNTNGFEIARLYLKSVSLWAWQLRALADAPRCRTADSASGDNTALYSVSDISGLCGRLGSLAATIRALRHEFRVDKLSDEFGQYTLVLKCSACGHERPAEPHTA